MRELHASQLELTDAALRQYRSDASEVTLRCRTCHQSYTKTAKSWTRSSLSCKSCQNPKRWSFDSFVDRARQLHGDQYEYPEPCTTSSQVISIRCLRCHRSFRQRAFSHLSGCGCPNCSIGDRSQRSKSSRFESFVRLARAVHGNRYEYDIETFSNRKSSIKIRCQKCTDSFVLRADRHLSLNGGCMSCHPSSEPKHDKFLAEALRLYQGRYRYEFDEDSILVQCQQCRHQIRCTATQHLSGNAICFECVQIDTKRFNKFLQQATQRHGARFDYSWASQVFTDQDSVLPLMCRSCGETVEVTARSHLNQIEGGHRCASTIESRVDRWIEQSIRIHGTRYDYSAVRDMFFSVNSPVPIRCKSCNQEHRWTINQHVRHALGCSTCFPSQYSSSLEQAIARHGTDRYDYTWWKLHFRSPFDKISIGCLECGAWFEDTPSDHVNGRGCPVCAGPAHEPRKII